jgi:hypothetical protein
LVGAHFPAEKVYDLLTIRPSSKLFEPIDQHLHRLGARLCGALAGAISLDALRSRMEISADLVSQLLPFILVGFLAQLVDGALGMAFGVISTTLLVSRGVDPAVASASVHAVEVFTTGASGISHTVHRNVNW